MDLPRPTLEIKDLRLVATIAAHGGVSKAATALGLSQSAVSHHLARIEERLGVPLFTRRGRTMASTAQGVAVAQLATELTERLLEAEATLKQAKPVRRITLCTQCYTGYHWLPRLLESWNQRRPEVEVKIAVESTDDPMGALQAGRVDVALGHYDPPDSHEWIRRPLFDDRFSVVLAPTHPLTRHKRLSPSHLQDETLFVYDLPTVNLRRLGREIFGEVGPANVRKVPLTEAIVELVKAGHGVSLMSAWAIRPWIDRGDVVTRPLAARGTIRHWHAVYRKGGPKQAVIHELVQVLRDTPTLGPP